MIEFQSLDVKMPNIDFEIIRKWIKRVVDHHNRIVGPLTYQFCNDAHIIEVNRQVLDHDFYTDIITFDYTRRNRISGDMLISLDTVASNAEMLHLPFDQELHRVIIHGVLHLLGYKDKTEEESENMRKLEDECLLILSTYINEK